MSLRALGYLTRRFSPPRIPRAQAVCSSSIVSQAGCVSVAGRPARALHTIVTKEVTRETVMKQDMEAEFEDWMKKNGRKYKDEKEKAMRFEIYKETVKRVGSYPRSLRPNCFADRTSEEMESICCCGRQRRSPATVLKQREFNRVFRKKVMDHYQKEKVASILTHCTFHFVPSYPTNYLHDNCLHLICTDWSSVR